MKLSNMLLSQLTATLLLVACADESQHPSKLHDLVVPGTTSGEQALMWADSTKLYLGQCRTKLPRRENCNEAVASKLITEAQAQANNLVGADINLAQTEKTKEIARIKATDATVVELTATQVQLRTELQSLQRELPLLQTEIKDTTAVETARVQDLNWFTVQLAAVANRLSSSPNDRNLRRLQEELMADKEAIDANLVQLREQLRTANARLVQVQALIANVTTDINANQEELNRHLAGLILRSPLLTTLNNKIATLEAAKASIGPAIIIIQNVDITQRSELLSASEQDAVSYLSKSMPQAVAIRAGRYEQRSGSANYCPQGVRPTISGNTLSKISLSFLSPCSGGVELSCNGALCAGTTSGYRFNLKILNSESYELSRNGNDVAVFGFKAPLATDVAATDFGTGSGSL